jgi:Ras-related protein Rab-5C
VQRQAKAYQRYLRLLVRSTFDSRSAMVFDGAFVTAKKLPLSVPQVSRAGAGRTPTGARTGVDLNKQPTTAQNEPCNC